MIKGIIIIIGILLLIASQIFGSTNYLLSDYEFTNTSSYSDSAYYSAYSNDYKDYEIRYVLEVCKSYQINPVSFFVRAWMEGRPKDSYHLGCNGHIEIKQGRTTHKSFYKQVVMFAQTYHNWYTNAPQYKYKAWLMERNGYYRCSNRATFAMYMYTPRYRQWIYGDYHGMWILPNIQDRVNKKLRGGK